MAINWDNLWESAAEAEVAIIVYDFNTILHSVFREVELPPTPAEEWPRSGLIHSMP